MIRVVHLINDLDVGGAERMLAKLIRGMDGARFRPHIITMLPGGSLVGAVRGAGATVESLGMRRGVFGALALTRLRRRLRALRPQILQTWMYHANLMGLLAGRGVPHTVWNIRSSITAGHAIPGGWVNRICARLSRRPAAVIVNCEAGRDTHAAIGYRPRRWHILPNAFDLKRYEARPEARGLLLRTLGLPPDAILTGTFARCHPVKGHAVLFDALARLANRYPSLHAVCAGARMSPDNEELSTVIRESGLQGRVHLLGERDDIPHLVAAVDMVVSPSLCEGFPNVLGEAMAAATPCIATRAGGCAEVLGDAGVLVPVGDPGALAEAVARLIDAGPDARRQLGRSARRRVESRFELSAVASRYEAFYEELVTCAG